jgi:hypothetical protein
MNPESLGFVQRLVLFFILPFRVLFDGHLARLVERAMQGDLPSSTPAPVLPAPVAAPAKVEEKPVVAAPAAPKVDVAAAEAAGGLHMLAILQREARLIDFFMEDVGSFSDAEVGAAVRVVHEGGRRVLKDYVVLKPVRSEDEESMITVDKGFDPDAVRLMGNVAGEPPYKGRLTHKGWSVVEAKLPVRQSTGPVKVIQPAEIEIP